MRTAYLDGCAGISGDMLLGAFLQAGVSVELLQETLSALELGATLETEEVDRSGIHAIKATIVVEEEHADHSESGHEHHHAHSARSLSAIREIIEHAPLPEPVQATAIHAFELLGEAEAIIHQVPIESIHFHEVGAVDAIADIVLAATAAYSLGIEAWYGAPLNVGSGMVQCAHGWFPVPAPATAELLRGAPTYSSGVEFELVTPTGAALMRALNVQFNPTPIMRVEYIGYGAGTRNPPGFANVLRLSVGVAEEIGVLEEETVTVIETAVDDLNPQVIGYVTEQAFQLGAIDVMCTPVFMKKNRPGTLLTILTGQDNVERLKDLIFRETSTLGIRIHEERRHVLERRWVSVTTVWGEIRVKVGFHQGYEVNATPEFTDCRKISEEQSVPLKRVMEEALQAYRNGMA